MKAIDMRANFSDGPRRQPTLGEIAVGIAMGELGVREEPTGSNTGPRIREYLSGCARWGRPVGLDKGQWCAAFASWCGNEATKVLAQHDQYFALPHDWRISVHELVEDARSFGMWISWGSTDWPRIGDLVVFRRAGGNPLAGGLGHVGRVIRAPLEFESEPGRYQSIDGNVSNAVSIVDRSLVDKDLCGWIRY